MCLLVHQPANTTFDREFLAGVYSLNRDGLGVMFADAGRLHVLKTLPTSADEFVDFYDKHAAGRECIWHARMQTHGDIDIDNCHPYRVTDNIYLAHNGVLATGNDWDTTRSDTWHFIRNVIEPAVSHDPTIVLRPDWQTFIGSVIGSSNKFGIMTATGDAIIINRKSGVEFNGAWLSNTYAWHANKYNIGNTYRSHYSRPYWDEYDWEQGYSGSRTYTARTPSKIASKANTPATISKASLPAITKAARNSYIRGTLLQWINDAPAKAAALVDEIEGYQTGESAAVIAKDPEFALEIIADWFELEGFAAGAGC